MTDKIINPFVRGYQDLQMRRVLRILNDDMLTMHYRACHPCIDALSDEQVVQEHCLYNDNYVVLTGYGEVSDEIRDQCSFQGTVIETVWEITGKDAGQHVHLADMYSKEQAEELLRRWHFETGHYSQCWEISTEHISAASENYLSELIDRESPTALMFEVFGMPCTPRAVGIKLYDTPWIAENLEFHDIESTSDLYQEQLNAGVPEDLLNVLHLAAAADTRILIFDQDAPTLTGLPVFLDALRNQLIEF